MNLAQELLRAQLARTTRRLFLQECAAGLGAAWLAWMGACSRVLLQVHYASDVLAGLVGAGADIVCTYWATEVAGWLRSGA